ncbi:MAG: hypothetical protein Q4B64_06030 [Spirochaetales bacterium]|nr:hypothetical protein [Spirochaetales bacterium]
MIDLTLDSMLVPALEGYKPVVGKKIEYTALNKGGLSTQQVVENIAMPFIKQRSILVEESATTSVIEFDASIMISGEDIIFTLDRGASPGIEIQIMCLNPTKIRYIGITKNSEGLHNTLTDELNAFALANYIWTGTGWFCSSAPGLGAIKEQFPGTSEPYKIYGGQWTELKLAGMYLRAAGGDARPYTEPMKVSVSGTSVIVDSLDTNSNSSLSTLAVGDLLIGGEEYRTVTAITGNTITINKEFTHSDITTILIGQNDQLQGHEHYYSHGGPDDAFDGVGVKAGILGIYTTSGIVTNGKNGNPRVGNETRGKNLTVRYWKRIA